MSTESTGSFRRSRLLAGIVLLALGLVVIAFAAIRRDGSSESPTKPDGADRPAASPAPAPAWPREIEYRPLLFGPDAFDPPETADPTLHGLRLWVDFEGWFLWSVGSDRDPVTISITVDSTFPEEGIRTIGPAEARLLAPNVLVVEFSPGGADFAGVRFNPGFFTGTVEIRSTPEDTGILLGTRSVPAALPLELRKGEEL